MKKLFLLISSVSFVVNTYATDWGTYYSYTNPDEVDSLLGSLFLGIGTFISEETRDKKPDLEYCLTHSDEECNTQEMNRLIESYCRKTGDPECENEHLGFFDTITGTSRTLVPVEENENSGSDPVFGNNARLDGNYELSPPEVYTYAADHETDTENKVDALHISRKRFNIQKCNDESLLSDLDLTAGEDLKLLSIYSFSPLFEVVHGLSCGRVIRTGAIMKKGQKCNTGILFSISETGKYKSRLKISYKDCSKGTCSKQVKSKIVPIRAKSLSLADQRCQD